MKKYGLVFLGFCCVAGLFVIWQTVIKPNDEHSRPLVARIDDPQLLNADERQVIIDALLVTQEAQNPRAAMTSLRQMAEADGRVLRSCHPLVHTLGQSAYLRYQDFATAMQYRDEFCNSGYVHGVIEARFSEGINQDELLALCEGETGLRGWECWHGIGHGLMYANENDLPDSLANCDGLPTLSAQNACQNGVFMENFNSNDTAHPSIYRSTDQPLYPCADQRVNHQANCYGYALSYFLGLNPGAYGQALSICRTAPAKWQWACSTGVGGELAKQNLDRLGTAIRWCDAGIGGQSEDCLNGFLGYLYLHVGGDVEEGRQLCRQLTTASRQTCYDRMTQSDQF